MRYLLLLTLLCSSCTVPPKMSEIDTKEIPPILRVEHHMGVITSHGSGVLVKYKGQLMIISAHHVFEYCTDASTISFLTQDRKPFKCILKRIVMLPAHDMIVIYVSNIASNITPMQVGSYQLNDTGFAAGYPDNERLLYGIGQITSERIRYSGTVKSGMSGGPLIVNGRVVGIASTRTAGEDAGEFIPVEKALELIK